MIALRRAILMKANHLVSLHAHRLFSGRACLCKKDPCYFQGPLPTFLVLSTAHAGTATKAVGAFVLVKLADKCRDKI